MKKSRFSILAVILTCIFLTSCSDFSLFQEQEKSYHHNILKEIYDTMMSNPDRALEKLKGIDIQIVKDDFSDKEYHEYQILLAEAYYKNYLQQLNYNEIIAAEYYLDSLAESYPNNVDILFLDARASYYRGVRHEETENIKDAFVSYLKSLETIEKINTKNTTNRQKQDILHFNALIYTRLGDILYWYDIYNAAIECINNANRLFQLENNTNAMARNHIIMAIIKGLNSNHDEALTHLHIADSLANKSAYNTLLKNDIERIKASVMYNIGYEEEAFNSVLRQYNTLDNDNQIMEAAGVLGEMYYDKKIYDSAIYYYERYFPDNKYSKINIAKNIFEICVITGDNELIAKYAQSLAEETNKEISIQSLKTELISLYIQHKTKIEDSYWNNVIIFHLFIILATASILVVIGLHFAKSIRKKYNKEILEKKNHINSLQKKINDTNNENKHIKTKIKKLENKILDYKNNASNASFEQRLESIKNNNIYKRLYEISIDNSIKTNYLYTNLQLNELEIHELINLFNKGFDNILNQIISENNGLKYHDMLYFCLYIIGFDEKHIAAVTGKTYNAVWSRTRKIQEILGNKKITDIIKERLAIA